MMAIFFLTLSKLSNFSKLFEISKFEFFSLTLLFERPRKTLKGIPKTQLSNDRWLFTCNTFMLHQTYRYWIIRHETSESKHFSTVAGRVEAGGGTMMDWGMFS